MDNSSLNVDMPCSLLWRLAVDFDAFFEGDQAEGVFVVMVDGERKSVTRVGLGENHTEMTAHALTLFACLSALNDLDLAPQSHLILSCGHKPTVNWLTKGRFELRMAGTPVALQKLQGQLSDVLGTFGRVTAFLRPVDVGAAVCAA